MGTNKSAADMKTRYQYRVEDPGTPEHGTMLVFGAATPPMFARERFTLASGRLTWIEYVGPVAL
jgi:hypothetical protein